MFFIIKNQPKGRNNLIQNISLGSLFDGIGGFPYAASFFGIRPVWASEILPDCISITKKRIPEMIHLGDITQIDGSRISPVDIITFGSPCQGLSITGNRLGLADERSGLFTEAIRIITEIQEATNGKYPQFAVWENVPGALSSAGGCDFMAVLEAFTKSKIPMPCSGRWARAGMVRSSRADLAWCVYDAQYFGTAQRRRRVFLVADFTGKRSGQILFVPKSLRRYFAEGGTPRQGITACSQNNSGVAIEILNDQGGSSISIENQDISPTLRCETHGHLPIIAPAPMSDNGQLKAWGFDLQQITSKLNHTTMKPVQPTLCAASSPHVVTYLQNAESSHHIARRLTPMECERLQGYPDGWTEQGHDGKIISDTRRYQMLGNSIAVPCVTYIMQGITECIEKEAANGC